MGCKGSKLEEQQAVALCRGRSDLLAAAIRQRYALADAHSAVSDSLLSFSASLHRLFLLSPPSPSLPLPPHRKPDPSPPPSPPNPNPNHLHSRSHSDSHIHFHPSDSEPESDNDSPPLHHYQYGPEPAYPLPPNNTFFNLYYAKSKPPPPSVSVEQRPPSSDPVYSAYSYYNPYTYPPPYSYGYGETTGGFVPPPVSVGPSARSSSRTPPPPPSPPRANTWDFLNPFEASYNYNYSSESYYPPYTPSRSSKEVREEEGIPELEDDHHEVVKEAYRDEKSVASASTQDMGRTSTGERSSAHHHHTRHETGSSNGGQETQEVIDKAVVGNETRRASVAANTRRTGEVSDIFGEIKNQFERAAEATRELGALLEIGKRRYHHKSSVYQVSTIMGSAIAQPFVSTEGDWFETESKMVGSAGLSLTLQKLYIWEKKLYHEVKAEEKMRLMLAKNAKRLRILDQRGAEQHKIDATRKLVRKLSTKIRISVQVIDSISKKINRLRDEELWPQINALIQGFAKMLGQMLDCHEIQYQLITEAKYLDSILSSGKLGDTAVQLELELMKWTVNFSSWVNTQKSYVKALNGWLSLCLNHEPEVTDDGPAPSSPGRMGAPPVFVICNIWSQAMERISDGDVIDAMQSLASHVRHLSDQQVSDQQEQVVLMREREKWTKEMERRTHDINKQVDSLNRKLALVPGQSGLLLGHCGLVSGAHYQNSESGGVQSGLKRLIEALKSFAASSLQVYEDLYLHAQEEVRVARENAKVP